MKNRRTIAILLFFALVVAEVGVVPASAQTRSNRNRRVRVTTSTLLESVPEWENRAPEQISQWHAASNAIRDAVSKLPADAVLNMPIPILFGVALSDITKNYGEIRASGNPHEGLDILADKGSPIVSPTQAVVLGVGVWAGGGNYVSTANPGGETFIYMHLDQPSPLTPGTVLAAGDFIGYVGNTGNASGGPPHVHFEIRKDRVPTDPYPRLTREFSLAEKMALTGNMLARSANKAELMQLLMGMYADEFLAAQTAGITLPPELAAELQRVSSGGLGIWTATNLTLGMSGKAVVALQNFLITQNKGPAGRMLASAGATGNFGPLTQSALIEYQHAVGISPADGNYNPSTRAYVAQIAPPTTPAPLPTPSPVPPPTPGTGSAGTGTSIPAGDLTIGSRGPSVVLLQTFLINARSGAAGNALAQAGATGYFGPITRAALAEYQAKAGITPAAGYFGSITRAYMIKL